MLDVTRKLSGDVLSVKIRGTIEENVDFSALFGPLPKTLEVTCRDITRINSIGIKAWLLYFQGCVSRGVKVRFLECSVAIVDQVNHIHGFTCGGEVCSISVPFFCNACKLPVVSICDVNELVATHFALPDVSCEKCHQRAVFDDQPDEFFLYFMKSR